MRGRVLKTGALIGALVCGVLAAGAASAQAAAPPPQPPPELWSQAEDAELAAIIADIFLLRQINEAGLTRDQIRQLIPVLEGVLGDADRLQGDVKRKLLEQRRLLLEGKQTAQSAESAKRDMQESARRFAEQAKKSMERTRAFLSPEQVERLTHILTARPREFFKRRATSPRETRRPGERPRERERAVERPGLGGPSTVVLRRVIGLLQEKLRVM